MENQRVRIISDMGDEGCHSLVTPHINKEGMIIRELPDYYRVLVGDTLIDVPKCSVEFLWQNSEK